MRTPTLFKTVVHDGVKVQVPRYRHTLADKGARVEPETILEWLNTKHYPYTWDIDANQRRDKALVSFTYLLCGRIGEVLRLQRKQLRETKAFLFVDNYVVEKNDLNPIRDTWALPKKGRLAPFTLICLEYLSKLPKEQTSLFTIKRSRAWQIIHAITGKWCHWLRAMGEAYYMRNVFKEPVKCAVALRLRRSDTLIEYVPYEWKDVAKQLTA